MTQLSCWVPRDQDITKSPKQGYQWPYKRTYVLRILFKQGSQLALCTAEIAHLVSILICCLFETFRWDLKWDVLFETFWNFWIKMCYLKLLKWDVLFETFEMRCAIWNFWNLKLLKWDVLFETFETWNLKLLKWDVLFETFETHYWGGFKIPCN